MTFHAMTEHYEEITVCGKPALFTSIRIRRDTIPDGLYAYDVRHDAECMKLTGLARNTYYKYKRQIRAELMAEQDLPKGASIFYEPPKSF